jgi:hypothetical protein
MRDMRNSYKILAQKCREKGFHKSPGLSLGVK